MKKLEQEYLDKIDEIVAVNKRWKGPMKLELTRFKRIRAIFFWSNGKISETIGVPVSKVYGGHFSIQFYNLNLKVKHVIAVCLGKQLHMSMVPKLF